MPKESRSRMQKWPSSTLCPPNSTVTGTTHFYPVAIRSAHVICAQALSSGKEPQMTNELFGEVISSYSRAQAIEDGVFVDVSATAKEAGIKFPVAMTRTVWGKYAEVPLGVKCQ